MRTSSPAICRADHAAETDRFCFPLATSRKQRMSEPSAGPKRPRLSRGWIGAGNRIRTGDPQLGKLMLYQLSYSRSERKG